MRENAKAVEQKTNGIINTGRQKRMKDLEDHHDCCGNDLNSLFLSLDEKFDDNLNAHLQSVLTEASEWYLSNDFQAINPTSFENFTYHLPDLNPIFLFIDNSDADPFRHQTAFYLNIEQIMAVLNSQKC